MMNLNSASVRDGSNRRGQSAREGRSPLEQHAQLRCDFTNKTMDFPIKTADFPLKTADFLLKRLTLC